MEAETAEKTIFAALWVDAGAPASTQAPKCKGEKSSQTAMSTLIVRII